MYAQGRRGVDKDYSALIISTQFLEEPLHGGTLPVEGKKTADRLGMVDSPFKEP